MPDTLRCSTTPSKGTSGFIVGGTHNVSEDASSRFFSFNNAFALG